MMDSHRSVVTAAAVMIGGALYVCACGGASSDTTVPDVTGGPAPPSGSGGPAGSAGQGSDNSSKDAAVTAAADVGAPMPAQCALTEPDAGGAPEIEDACRACVAERCCAKLTKCHRAPPAPAGAPLSDGVKSACQLFGECEATCFGADGGLACEDACLTAYGEPAAVDWFASDQCLYEPSPQGCACP